MAPQGSWSLGQLPEGVQRGMLAAGLYSPSLCGKMYSSWGRAPRDWASAKGKQNPSVCPRSCHKVKALCSDAAAAAGRRHGRASCPQSSRAAAGKALEDVSPGHRDNSCPQEVGRGPFGAFCAGNPPADHSVVSRCPYHIVPMPPLGQTPATALRTLTVLDRSETGPARLPLPLATLAALA